MPEPAESPRVPHAVKVIAAAVVAAAGLGAAVWSGLGNRRDDLDGPARPLALAASGGATTEDARREQLAARFGVKPESIRLDGQPGLRRQPVAAPDAAGAGSEEKPAPVFVDTATPEQREAAASSLRGSVASAAVQVKGLSDTPTAAADAVAAAAVRALLGPLGGPDAGVAAWGELATGEGQSARDSLARALATVLAGAKIDPSQATVSRFDPAAGPMGLPTGGGGSRAVIAMPTPQAFPAVANMQGKPAVLVRLPVQLPDGTGANGRLEVAAVLVYDAASKSWQPGMFQLTGENASEVMALSKAIRAARGGSTPAAPKAG